MALGQLALRPGWPSMMRGYLHEDERYKKCFSDGWYLSGDLAHARRDGYFWFVGRADDMIKSAGHLIGPFEVESALMEHEAVAEAADRYSRETAGEIVKALVALKPGFTADEDLRKSLLGPCPQALGSGRRAEGDRLPRKPAEDAQRQDHAPAAEGARTGSAGRRHLDPGE
jgi:acetyl-CoA synthetase